MFRACGARSICLHVHSFEICCTIWWLTMPNFFLLKAGPWAIQNAYLPSIHEEWVSLPDWLNAHRCKFSQPLAGGPIHAGVLLELHKAPPSVLHCAATAHVPQCCSNPRPPEAKQRWPVRIKLYYFTLNLQAIDLLAVWWKMLCPFSLQLIGKGQ